MPTAVLRPEIVAENFRQLRAQKTHSHFAGYLAVKRAAAGFGRGENLDVDFIEFFKTFLSVPGGPHRKPYLRPFWERPIGDKTKWLNPNPPGSYAPRSLRSNMPFTQVVTVVGEGNDGLYSLKERHWELAIEHLTYGLRVNAVLLASVLYRDFAVTADDPMPAHLVAIFREEFGYVPGLSANADEEFAHIYVDDGQAPGRDDWFVRLQ